METAGMTSFKKKYGKAKEAVIAAHEAGLSYAEASAKYGFPVKTLYDTARKLGLSLKKKK